MAGTGYPVYFVGQNAIAKTPVLCVYDQLAAVE
jgi:hypothetical protein